jgi:hypothetical protein
VKKKIPSQERAAIMQTYFPSVNVSVAEDFSREVSLGSSSLPYIFRVAPTPLGRTLPTPSSGSKIFPVNPFTVEGTEITITELIPFSNFWANTV